MGQTRAALVEVLPLLNFQHCYLVAPFAEQVPRLLTTVKLGTVLLARNWVGSFLVTCCWCTDYRAGSYGFVTVDMRGCKPSLGMSLHMFLLFSSRGSLFGLLIFDLALLYPCFYHFFG